MQKIKEEMKVKINKLDRLLYGDSAPGGITDEDFDAIKKGIDEVKPKVFIEIGAGRSTRLVFEYLCKKCPSCVFYTIDPIIRFLEKAGQDFETHKNFNSLLGLSVKKEDLVSPALEEFGTYSGDENILVDLLESKFKNRKVDMLFIDSREGSAVAEFKAIEKYLSAKAIVFCHDVLNGGTGHELQEYLKDKPYKCTIEPSSVGTLRVEKI